ncbi:MAG: hypothetical protein WC765_08825 [Phycisphaerae bacterium]|jgi:hypothetical protein
MDDELKKFWLAVGGVAVSGETLKKLLGPTADYFGECTKELVKKTAHNVGRIFSIAFEKLGEKIDEPGNVNPRILKNICDEGRFVEDVFVAEYFGGLLASSRSENSQDDTVLPYLSIVKTMSSNQLYLHFIIYSIVARLPFGRVKPAIEKFWDGLTISIPINETIFHDMKNPSYVKDAVLGLVNIGLIKNRYSISVDCLNIEKEIEAENGWLKVAPNEYGAELFLKALGYKTLNADVITSVHVDLKISKFMKDSFELPEGFKWNHEPFIDPLDKLRDEFESRIDDIESAVDDVESNVDDIKDNSSNKKAETKDN